MQRKSLKKNSGMGIFHTKEGIELGEVKYSKKKVYEFEDLYPQLLNGDLQNIDVSYTKFCNIDIDKALKAKNIKANLLHIPPEVIGIEYMKTKATKCSKYNKIIEIINGSGLLIIQKFVDVNNQETLILNVKSTNKIIIPAGYTYSLINNKTRPLIALEFMPFNAKNKIVLDDMKGMSYYVIKKNAKKEIVKNPLYKIIEKYRKIDCKKYYKKYNITPKTPIFRQLLRKPEKFEWFFTPVKNNASNNISL